MKNKKQILTIVLIAVAIVSFSLLAFGVDASRMPIPQAGDEAVDQSTLPGYIKALYNWALAIIGVSALIVVIFGGYRLMTSAGNPEAMKGAKQMITQALIGLGFALSIFLILNLIDPDLVTLDFEVPNSSSILKTENCVKINSNEDCPNGKNQRVWYSCMNQAEHQSGDFKCCCDKTEEREPATP